MKTEDRILPETHGAGNKSAAKKSMQRVTSLRILVMGGLGVLLYFAHVAFIPIALALLLALILSSPVEALRRWHVPRGVSAALLLTLIIGLFAALVNFASEPAQKWFAVAPHTVRVIEKKIRPLAQLMGRIGDLRNSAGNLGNASRPTAQAAAPVAEENAPVMLLDVTRTVVLSSVTVLILTLFLLFGGPPMLARMVSAGASDLHSTHIISVIEKVRSEVGRFYVTTALINVGLGTATALAMLACGMPNPFLWGLMAAILNFIPYAGSTTTLIVLTLVAIMSFDTLAPVLAVSGSYLVLATLEGQIVQPLLVGRRLELNPMLVFLTLWFGGFFWGIPGIILATPTLVALKVIAENAKGGKPVLEFLSRHGPE